MGIAETVKRVLTDYAAAKEEQFARHPLAHFIRFDLASAVREAVEDKERYLVEASPGQGNWARVPWVAVFDTLVTRSAQSGYYPVLLFRGDMTGLYLSLNQGVTEVEAKYKSEATSALAARAEDFRQQLGGTPASLPESRIELRASGTRLARLYEVGNICAAFYPEYQLPTDAEWRQEFRHVLGLYESLVYNETLPSGSAGKEADETAGMLVEDLRRFRLHKRIERNAVLAREVKRLQGTRCSACRLSFKEFYGSLGEGYIEAHHLTPVAQLKGQRLRLDPKTDFVVLCTNCHAMIHRYPDPSDLEGFRQHHIRTSTAV